MKSQDLFVKSLALSFGREAPLNQGRECQCGGILLWLVVLMGIIGLLVSVAIQKVVQLDDLNRRYKESEQGKGGVGAADGGSILANIDCLELIGRNENPSPGSAVEVRRPVTPTTSPSYRPNSTDSPHLGYLPPQASTMLLPASAGGAQLPIHGTGNPVSRVTYKAKRREGGITRFEYVLEVPNARTAWAPRVRFVCPGACPGDDQNCAAPRPTALPGL